MRIKRSLVENMFRLNVLLLFLIIIFSPKLYAAAEIPRSLTLEDAIYLAIRENPNVKQARLSQVLEGYALELAKWQFKPQFSFSATQMTQKNYQTDEEGYVTQNNTGANAKASWTSPYGTKVSLAPSVNQSQYFNPGLTLEVMQPLMRGFGRPIVEASLRNAMDSEKISRLNVEVALRAAVTAVINGYLDVLAAEKTLSVDEEALQRSETSVKQTELFIKSGRKAGVELVTVEADVANARTRIENDKNALQQARYALLTAIGLDPNSSVTFSNMDMKALIKKYPVPNLNETKKLVLDTDMDYQVSQITLEGAKKRSLLSAEDNARWRLDLTGSAHAGDGIGGGPNAGIQSLMNGVNQTNMLQLNLEIPIGDKQAKTNIATAKIALRQAMLALQQQRWSKETSAINGWNSIDSAKRALEFAEHAAVLQHKTYDISFQKYSHGLIDSLQLQSVEQQLVQTSQSLNAARINYIKALVNLDQMIGRTLQTWKVDVRYGEPEV